MSNCDVASTAPSTVDHPIYLETVTAPTNIACIKYWGKASVALNTPINSSVSVTLDQKDLRAVTTVAASAGFTKNRLWLNGVEELDAPTSKRFLACLEGVRALATDRVDPETGELIVRAEDLTKMKVHVSSYNTFPTAAGLASSAAGYAALVAGLGRLYGAVEVYPGQLSTIARQGSGSACRSLYGGFVAWRMGHDPANDGSDSLAQQVADENHWPELRALILVVSAAKKDTSSTSGMSTSVATSKLLGHRASSGLVDERMRTIESAFLAKDFPTFAQVTMADSNQFHATCLDTYPPIFYMNDVSKSIIKIVHAYNAWAGEIRAGYTFDAGPNAVIYTLEAYVTELSALMLCFYPSPGEDLDGDDDAYFNNREQGARARAFELDPTLVEAATATGRDIVAGQVKQIYYTKSGPGPQTLGPEESLIDPVTGLNIYKP